jgi:chorismate dehydratase
LEHKIKVGAVSYLNTKPLIYGFEQGMMKDELDLVIDYPSNIATALQNDEIDIGLVPVACIAALNEHYIISDYCIGCDGEIASVCLFSDVPLHEIKTVLLDYQSRTSVELLKILLKEHWKISPQLKAGTGNYEQQITGTTAGLVIGDRAFQQRTVSKYVYDLGLVWKEMTGLPFVFATWVSNKKLPASFIYAFNAANETGFLHLDEVVSRNPLTIFDLKIYYTDFVKFKLDSRMQAAKALFLSKLNTEMPVIL